MITLQLSADESNLEYVRGLPGINDLEIDEDYGLVLISPKRKLYTIRASGDVNSEKLISIQPKIKGVYGDSKIAPI
jgi:hypothetical protein